MKIFTYKLSPQRALVLLSDCSATVGASVEINTLRVLCETDSTVSIASAAVGWENPWLFKEAMVALLGGTVKPGGRLLVLTENIPLTLMEANPKIVPEVRRLWVEARQAANELSLATERNTLRRGIFENEAQLGLASIEWGKAKVALVSYRVNPSGRVGNFARSLKGQP